MAYEWVTLDSSKAEYSAVAGCYAHRTVCLERANGSVVVVGQLSCESRERAERELDAIKRGMDAGLGTEGDRHITRATFNSWRK